jgi:hypothetical protein
VGDPGEWWRNGVTALAQACSAHAGLLIGGGVGSLWLIGASWLLTRLARRARLARGARWVEITAPPQTDPHGARLLWAGLEGLRVSWWRRLLFGQPHLAWEIHGIGHQLRIGVWVSGPIPPEKVERAIRGAWPGCRTTTAALTTHRNAHLLPPGGPDTPLEVPAPIPAAGPGHATQLAAARLLLAKAESLPLRFDNGADPLRAVLAALTDLPDGRTGCVQILARPAGGRATRQARQAAGQLISGTAGASSGSGWAGLVRGVARAVVVHAPMALLGTHSGSSSARTGQRTSGGASKVTPRPALAGVSSGWAVAGPGDPTWRRAVRDKIGVGALWQVQCRVAVTLTSPTPLSHARGEREHRECVGRVDTLAGAFAAYTGHNRARRARLWRASAMRSRHMGDGQLWSVPELAELAHLPLDPRASGLARAGAARLNPPPQLPAGGPDTKALGHAADNGRPVAMTVEAARGHIHVEGQTGVGKSTFLANLALDDITAGRGVVLVEPKGDLGRDVIDRIPEQARDRLIVLDPDAPGPVPSLNLLDPDQPGAVENLIGIFSRLYPHWGPRLEQALRVACLTAIAHYRALATRDPHARRPHLGDVLELFLNDAHRARATTSLTAARDRYLRAWWDSYQDLPPGAREMRTGPLTNRLLALLLREFPRTVLTGDGPPLDLAKVIDGGGICIARLPEGVLEPDTVSLLGSLVVARTWQAATARSHLPEDSRADATLLLDEAQMFLNMPHSLEALLARARGYRLGVVLAHQNQAQLVTSELKAAVATNTLTKIYFRSPDDATALERHVTPRFTSHDLAHLDAYHAAARIHHHGADTPAFTLATAPLPPTSTRAPDSVPAPGMSGPGAGGRPVPGQRSTVPPPTRPRQSRRRPSATPRHNHGPIVAGRLAPPTGLIPATPTRTAPEMDGRRR